MKTVTTINAEDLAAAQRWFARLLAPDCSDAERAWFEHWRDTAPAHLAAYRQVEDVWQRSERTRQDPAIAAALREARHPASGRARRVWWPALAVAASLLVAVGLMFRHQLLPDNVPAIRYATVLGEQRSVTLKDGSQVILDTASELLVQYGSRERKLTLQRGRADFSVQHDDDAQRPFVVHAATGTVTATGTQFQVRVESGIGTVTLLEGQVRVAAQDGEQQQVATLAPGERIAIQSTGLGQLQHIPEAALASARGWTEGSLVVKGWPLEAVLVEMNRYSNIKFRLGDDSLRQVPISGVFKAGDQQSLALSLEYGWPIRVERPAYDEIILRRK